MRVLNSAEETFKRFFNTVQHSASQSPERRVVPSLSHEAADVADTSRCSRGSIRRIVSIATGEHA